MDIKQDFVGDFIVDFKISTPETVLRTLNLGRSAGAGSDKCCVLKGYTRTTLFYKMHITLQLNSKVVSCLSTRHFITVRDVSA